MSSKVDVENVEKWIKGTLPRLHWSKQEIDSLLLRGPAKDAFLDFLVPRFRTSDQIDVIRSNLYINGINNDLQSPSSNKPSSTHNYNPNQNNDQEEQLRKELSNLEAQKVSELQKLVKNVANLNSNSNTTNDNDNSTLDLEMEVAWKRKHLNNINDMIRYTEGALTDLNPLLETENSVILEREKKPELCPLKEIQAEAVQLFQSIFFDTDDINPSANAEIQRRRLDANITRLCDQLVKGGPASAHTGLGDKELVIWHKNEIQMAKEISKGLKAKFQKPMEEQAGIEVDLLKTELTKEHLRLQEENKGIEKEIQEVEGLRRSQQMINIANSSFNNQDGESLSYFLKLIREEELKSQIQACRDLRSQHGPNCGHGQSQKKSRLSTGFETDPALDSILPGEEDQKQEKLEKLICALFRAYPPTKQKLLDSVQVKTTHGQDLLQTLRRDVHLLNPEGTLDPNPSNQGQDDVGFEFEEMVSALNPNNEKYTSSFVHQYQNQTQYQSNSSLSHSILNPLSSKQSQLPSLLHKCKILRTLSDKNDQANLDLINELIQSTRRLDLESNFDTLSK